MTENRRPVRVKEDQTGALLGWLRDAAQQARLAWRLFWDARVPVWTKLIPPTALAYVLFPVDILPDLVPFLGQVDDLAVVLIGAKLFIELAPPEVVREHLRALGADSREWKIVDQNEPNAPVIDGDYKLEGPTARGSERAE